VNSAIRVLACALLVACASGALAQAYPARPIRVIVNFPGGGNVDNIARMLAGEMEKRLGQNIVIDNRAGANGIIGIETAARATPDGYNLLFTPSSIVVNQAARTSIPYNVLRDFAPVSNACWGDGYLMVVHPSVPAQSIKELIALARDPSKRVLYGIPGLGNPQHFLGELFNLSAGTRMTAVAYKGVPQQITALISGEVNVIFVPPLAGKPHVDAGRMRALAYTGDQRWDGLPKLPTVGESAIKGFEWRAGWQGLFAPAKTPPAIVQKLSEAVRAAVQAPQVKTALVNGGYEPIGSSPAEFRRFIETELKRFSEIARKAQIKVE